MRKSPIRYEARCTLSQGGWIIFKQARINKQIRVPQVRLISSGGEQIGIVSVQDALSMSEEQGLDLVEVAPQSQPPVCRILDYGKYKYEQSKRAKMARKKHHFMHLKEVKLRPKIEEHDFQFKVNHAKKFLESGNKVKFTVYFRGREITHKEFGKRLLERIIEVLNEVATVELSPKSEGRNMVMTMIPKH
ncbi:translation initiation factor IF-3 [bacterium]|nr:translation initiation factor IF-3 [bacterium]